MGRDSATDVVTIPYDAPPGTPREAEIFVNVALSERNAVADKRPEELPCGTVWTPAHELALYIAHGFDHLAGFDDHKPHDYAIMRQRELEWVFAAHKEGLVDALFK